MITTHYLEEAEKLCDYIAIIHKGELIASERKEALLARIDEKTLIMTLDCPVVKIPKNPMCFSPTLTQRARSLSDIKRSDTGK